MAKAALHLAPLLRRQPRETERAFKDRIWLLGALLEKNRGELFLEQDRILSASETRSYERARLRRKKGEPLQYIVGWTEFWGRRFAVKPGVLIPRPETERLVEIALERFGNGPLRILDVGTGSGAIALTLALERPTWSLSASDISPKALRIAEENAKSLGAPVQLFRADLLGPPIQLSEFDWIISNPPYLELGRDSVSQEVRDFEPESALEPAKKLRLPKIPRAAWAAERILRGCAETLPRPRGILLELSPRVAAFLEKRWKRSNAVASLERIADLAGRKRFLLIVWNQEGVGNGKIGDRGRLKAQRGAQRKRK